ncbi:MFS transporter [Cellulomonas chengniuliangii]|uniref:MFS transporter n=1 Tax=Cellulomonas chengniuliangii TaxID=2968084 RepID=A0ABY5KZ75_9CELL|nr:MFS transporter [Cellulomonas chengniuliangii]MCC2307487.1 MFS transporter [Cellulomonas chengniuliangii]UUI75739.1 MFS transporter [Cellulomonas chengniuliangii]
MRPPVPVGILPAVEPSLRHQRWSVTFLFTLAGLVIGGWASRVPDVKLAVGASSATWGAVNIASAVGVLGSMLLVAVLIVRVGPRRLSLVAAPLALLAPVVNALADHPWQLAPGLLVHGAALGLLQAPMNAQAVAVEKAYGRPILTSFHACFSIGALTGALLAAGAAAMHVSPFPQFALTSSLLAVGLVLAARRLPADPPRATGGQAGRAQLVDGMALLAVMAFLALFAEGVSANWSAIYARESVGALGAWPAATYGGFALAMVVGRLFGDRVRHRVGTERMLVGSGLLAAAGVGLALATHTTVGAIAGFAIAGLGLSSIVPTIYSLAGSLPGLPPGRGVALVALGAWPAQLIAPPLVGGVAELTGLRTSLLVVVACATAVAVLVAVRRGRLVPPAGRADAEVEAARG